MKPFKKGQKNDCNVAKAIAEAALRPNLKTVSWKTQDQLGLQALHRVRACLVSHRTATLKQICAFLIEQGITVRRCAVALCNALPAILGSLSEKLSLRMRKLIACLQHDWIWLDERIKMTASEIKAVSISGTCCQLLPENAQLNICEQQPVHTYGLFHLHLLRRSLLKVPGSSIATAKDVAVIAPMPGTGMRIRHAWL